MSGRPKKGTECAELKETRSGTSNTALTDMCPGKGRGHLSYTASLCNHAGLLSVWQPFWLLRAKASIADLNWQKTLGFTSFGCP